MGDYIRKQDASNWLKQYGQDVLHGKYKFSLMYIWKNLMDLPSADVVPVVRCRDCKHWRSYWGRCYKHDEYGMASDDFCSYGERKE